MCGPSLRSLELLLMIAILTPQAQERSLSVQRKSSVLTHLLITRTTNARKAQLLRLLLLNKSRTTCTYTDPCKLDSKCTQISSTTSQECITMCQAGLKEDMQSRFWGGATKMEWTTGYAETHGELSGEKMDTSRLRRETVVLMNLSGHASQRQLRLR